MKNAFYHQLVVFSRGKGMIVKMKIAMLGHKRIPSREGGVEIVVEELATRMVQKKHEVVVYNRIVVK